MSMPLNSSKPSWEHSDPAEVHAEPGIAVASER
jgi:hypothetical protein